MVGVFMAQDIASLTRQLERARYELQQAQAELAQLRRRRARTAGRPKQPLDPSEEERRSASYRISGTPEQLASFDFLLRHVSTACEYGSTAFYQLMVDGDGGASLMIERNGRRVGVSAEEEDWLFGTGERPSDMPEVRLRDEEVLEIEIV